MRRQRRLACALVGLVLLGSVVSCGVPSSDGAEPLPTEFNVIGPSDEPTLPSDDVNAVVEVAWVNGRDKLDVVRRAVQADTREEKLDAAMEVLVVGPSEADLAFGLSSTISTDAVLDANLRGKRAIVDVINPGSLQAPNPELQVAQLAVTALEVPKVRWVVFQSAGERTPVPIPKNPNIQRPLTMRDFRSLIG